MTKQKLSAKTILLYVTYVATVLLMGNVFDGLFSFGVYVGALYSANPIIVAILYLASSIVYGWQNAMYCAVRVAVTLLFVAIHYFAKKKISKFYLLLYVVLANVFYLAYPFESYFALFDKVLYTVCGVAFCFVSLYVFRAVFVRGIAYRPALDERICICIFVVAFSYCLSKINFSTLQLAYFVIPFAILFCNSCFDEITTMISATLFGLGNLLAVGTYDCFVFCVIASLLTVTFGKISRYLSAVGVVAVDVAMSYFLNLHGDFLAIVFAPTLTSVLVFVVIPSSVYNYLRDCCSGGSLKYTSKSISQKLMGNMSKRLYRLSNIFLSIKNAFYTLSVGKIGKQQVVANIVKQCSEQVCYNCSERTKCWRQNLKSTEQSFVQLAECGLSRGKCTILDIPQSLSVKCDRLAMLISNVNGQTQIHREFVAQTSQKQNARLLVAEQMGGVSNLLLQLATDYKKNVRFDCSCERELVEQLVFHNVMCCDALIVTQAEVLCVVVTVAKKDVDNSTIEQCVQKVVQQKMVVTNVENTSASGWVNVYLAVKPRFQATFGVTSVAKGGSQISADTHSQIFTDNGKCIVTLCDGMGSGQKAEQMSASVISLVESFYRAGFDSDTILSMVNQLLTQSENEIFCAMDIVVLDLYNGFADFVKLGATTGLVKCCGKVELVNGSSLPLGVLEEMKPSVCKKVLSTGDVVVLFSDGVVDCFKDINVLAEIFFNTNYTAPQSIAETLMAKALKKCNNNPPDDMTILVAKLI